MFVSGSRKNNLLRDHLTMVAIKFMKISSFQTTEHVLKRAFTLVTWAEMLRMV